METTRGGREWNHGKNYTNPHVEHSIVVSQGSADTLIESGDPWLKLLQVRQRKGSHERMPRVLSSGT